MQDGAEAEVGVSRRHNACMSVCHRKISNCTEHAHRMHALSDRFEPVHPCLRANAHSTHLYGVVEAQADAVSRNGVVACRVSLVERRLDEGRHAAQHALLVRVHVEVYAVPGDCCSESLMQFDV